MKIAATAILIAFLCLSCSRSTPEGATAASIEVSQVSKTLAGKQVTIRGKFSPLGKPGPYILLGNRQVVYVLPKGSFTWGKPYTEMERELVTATGTLRFYDAPPPAEPVDQAIQREPDHFYFESETTQLRLITH